MPWSTVRIAWTSFAGPTTTSALARESSTIETLGKIARNVAAARFAGMTVTGSTAGLVTAVDAAPLARSTS